MSHMQAILLWIGHLPAPLDVLSLAMQDIFPIFLVQLSFSLMNGFDPDQSVIDNSAFLWPAVQRSLIM